MVVVCARELEFKVGTRALQIHAMHELEFFKERHQTKNGRIVWPKSCDGLRAILDVLEREWLLCLKETLENAATFSGEALSLLAQEFLDVVYSKLVCILNHGFLSTYAAEAVYSTFKWVRIGKPCAARWLFASAIVKVPK